MSAANLLTSICLVVNFAFASTDHGRRPVNTVLLFVSVILFCQSFAYVALWLVARDYRVFRTMGFFFFVACLQTLWVGVGLQDSVWAVRALAVPLLVETAGQAMHIENRRWTWFFWPMYAIPLLAGWFPSMAFMQDWPLLFSEIALAILIFQGFRSNNRRDRMVAIAFLAYSAIRLTLASSFQNLPGIRNRTSVADWSLFVTITLTILAAVTLAIFVNDLISDRREKQRLATELEAARAIQQILIPESNPAVAGFDIRSIYQPFGEVGGDFFQILPLQNGGALIAIGDVSGKGLPAAMQVSLLVGNLRALTDYTQSPAEILTAINRHMMGRSNGGFTTCLILRADPDGKLTVANAGHINPYIDRVELNCANGLPLGLAEGFIYSESTHQLQADCQLMLTTDGVVEARSEAGELFGFERTAAISTDSAQNIARAAQRFGQDDDITVLTVARSTLGN